MKDFCAQEDTYIYNIAEAIGAYKLQNWKKYEKYY